MLLRIAKKYLLFLNLLTLFISAQENLDNQYWYFGKVKLKGSLVGKDRFSQFYTIEYGDQFTKEKHAHAVQNLLTELHNNGYLDAAIKEKIDYNKDSKTANVTITLSNLDCFVISNSHVKIIAPEFADAAEIKQFEAKINSFVSKAVNNNYFTSELVETQLADIKKYLSRKGFVNVVVTLEKKIDREHKTVSLDFSAAIGNNKRYVFKGNSFFSQENLLESLFILDDTDLFIPPALLVDDIKELYKRSGFINANVTWQETKNNFTFEIEEGIRVKVSKIEIVGDNKKIGAVRFLEKNCKDFYKQEFYDESVLQNCLEQFLDELKSQGFWDAAITGQDFEKLGTASGEACRDGSPGQAKTDGTYLLKLTLELGRQRFLKGVKVEGDADALKESGLPNFANGKIVEFDINLIDVIRKYLSKYYQDQGYLYVQVKPEILEEKDGDVLVWHIDKKTEKVKFGKTSIVGTTNVDESIILRELAYKEGEQLDREKLDQSLKKIKALNIFESVSLKTENMGMAQSAKDISIKCVPDDPFEIRTRLGFQGVSKSFTNISATTYIVGGSFLWKNPAKIADLFRVDADLTRYSRTIFVAYEFPWLFNQPIRTQSKVYSLKLEQPMIAHSHDRLYKEHHDGLALTFLPNYFTWAQTSVTTGFEFNKLSDVSLAKAHAIEYEPQLLNMRIPTFYVEPNIVINRFDNAANPTKGYFTRLLAKGVFPTNVKDGYFVKLLFEQSFAYPLYDNCVIGALRFRFGHIFNSKFNTILPTERFYLGGSCTLRGYETDMVPPLNTFLTATGQQAWAPVGGKTMVNLNAEIRFPIYKGLGGVVFNDMGVLTQDCFSDILGDKWLGATGLGLRYTTPLGPIRFDVGYKWKKRAPDDKRFAWFLTLGHAF